MGEALLLQRAGQADSRLAGCNREQEPARVEFIEHLARAGKQWNVRIARQIVVAVALGEARIVGSRQARCNMAQSVGEPEPDDKARLAIVRRRLLQIAACLL